MIIKVNSVLEVTEHLNGIKAVIFDMDDTLYSEKQYVKSGYKQIAQLLETKVENAEDKLWQYFLDKKNAIDELLKCENIYSEDLKKLCVDIYRNHGPEISLYYGVSKMLDKLKNQGYALGIITDGRPKGQRAKIKALGLEKMVDHIIITDELGGVEYRKPNPIAYKLMSEHFGVSYSEMLYVGDNPKKDFVACEKLGIRAVYFVNDDGLYSN